MERSAIRAERPWISSLIGLLVNWLLTGIYGLAMILLYVGATWAGVALVSAIAFIMVMIYMIFERYWWG